MSERILLVETAPFYDYSTHLVEATNDSRFLVVEGTGDDKRPKFLEVEGRFQHADLENHNGRIYPRQLWNKVLSDPQVVESLEEGSMLGELDHPSDGKSSLKNISHIVTGLRMESSGEVIGRARILNNEWGKQLRSIFEAGGKVGISSRGSGSVRPQGGVQVVQEDFKLNTFDFVVQPSTPDAFPKPKNESTFKSKNESVSLSGKGHKQEDRMNSIKRLNELREAVSDLTSETVEKLSKNVRSRLVEHSIAIEVELSRLLKEDASVDTVANELIDQIKAFRNVLEGEKPAFLKGKEDKKDDKDDKKDDGDSDDDDDDDDDKKDKKDKVKEALADMEKEPTVEEKLAEATAQRDAAIRQARITYRMAESALQSTGLVMNALRAKIKSILAGQTEKPAVAESTDLSAEVTRLKEENEKLTARNQRLETIINKVQEKMLEAEKAEESEEPVTPEASVEESVNAPSKKVATDPLPKMGTVKQIIAEQAAAAQNEGASLAKRALGVLSKVRTSHVNRGDQILESKANVK